MIFTQAGGDGPVEWVKKLSEQFSSEEPELCRPVVKLTFLANLKLHVGFYYAVSQK